MDLNSPLQSLSLRPDAARILAALSRVDHAMTGRQIARVIDSSPSQTARALNDLAHVGLVTRRRYGSAHLHTINTEHLLWPAVQTALQTRALLQRRMQQLIEDSSAPESTVVLYGSTARGEARADSDVDLLLVTPAGTPAEARDDLTADLTGAVERWTGNETQVYEVDAASLRQKARERDPIVDSWLLDGRALVGPP